MDLHGRRQLLTGEERLRTFPSQDLTRSAQEGGAPRMKELQAAAASWLWPRPCAAIGSC